MSGEKAWVIDATGTRDLGLRKMLERIKSLPDIPAVLAVPHYTKLEPSDLIPDGATIREMAEVSLLLPKGNFMDAPRPKRPRRSKALRTGGKR